MIDLFLSRTPILAIPRPSPGALIAPSALIHPNQVDTGSRTRIFLAFQSTTSRYPSLFRIGECTPESEQSFVCCRLRRYCVLLPSIGPVDRFVSNRQRLQQKPLLSPRCTLHFCSHPPSFRRSFYLGKRGNISERTAAILRYW